MVAGIKTKDIKNWHKGDKDGNDEPIPTKEKSNMLYTLRYALTLGSRPSMEDEILFPFCLWEFPICFPFESVNNVDFESGKKKKMYREGETGGTRRRSW